MSCLPHWGFVCTPNTAKWIGAVDGEPGCDEAGSSRPLPAAAEKVSSIPHNLLSAPHLGNTNCGFPQSGPVRPGGRLHLPWPAPAAPSSPEVDDALLYQGSEVYWQTVVMRAIRYWGDLQGSRLCPRPERAFRAEIPASHRIRLRREIRSAQRFRRLPRWSSILSPWRGRQ